MGTRVARGKGYREIKAVARESCAIAPRPCIELAKAEWRRVWLKKWTGRVGDGPDTVVNVPLDGVEAKLSIAIHAPKEQSTNAAKIRGLKNADSEVG